MRHYAKVQEGKTFIFIVLILLLAGIVLYLAIYPSLQVSDPSVDLSTGNVVNSRLLNLRPNTWIKLHQFDGADWHRQGHAGIGYNSRRGTLLIFGSDTHGRNWDNSVHEFNPITERWTTHYPPASKESYRADGQGRAVAGTNRLLPWAMHTYDNIEYDPQLDALVVTALPEHNPIKKKVPEARVHPTWIYGLKTQKWRIFENNGKPYPRFFAAASAYDEARDTLVAYKNGIWELGPARLEWQKATGESHHKIHYNMIYDSWRGNFAVFGDHTNTNKVWIYTPGLIAGSRGAWKERIPGGDPCPPGQHFPAAFDREKGVFLLVVNNHPRIGNQSDDSSQRKSRSASTFIYNPDANVYRRLPDAELPPLGMNYMMAYDGVHKTFLLITGDYKQATVVWALKLEY